MADITDQFFASLADRYRFERHIGAGGMATVYLAEDLRHQRLVAVKVLRPEVAAILGAERFLKEITTTAGLQHPHILPLFDSGQSDDFLYYVMPFVSGETLREKLERETQLPIEEAVAIAVDVADALDYAHRQGVVHRDIKPSNILLHDGRPMVTDFGIALALSEAGGERLTETGLSVGTPAYMSPEQAAGSRELGPRSDVYTLGAVLYEMLAGRPPHPGGSAIHVVRRILTEDVPPVESARKSVPPHVGAAVAKALEKLPADRFDTAKAFRAALIDPRSTPVPTRLAGTAAGRGPPQRWGRPGWSLLILLLGATLGVGVASLWSPRPTMPATPSLRLTEMVGMEGMPAVSPDGQTLALTASVEGRSQIWVRPMAEGAPIPVTQGDYDYAFPRWADENTLVYYRHPTEGEAEGSLWRLLVSSGTPAQRLGAAEGEADVSHSGSRVATFVDHEGSPVLAIIDMDSWEPDTLIALPSGVYRSPRWSPDDRQIAFQVQTGLGVSALRVLDLGMGGEPATIVEPGEIRGLAWLQGGSGIVYASSEGSTLPYPPVFTLRVVGVDGSPIEGALAVGDAGYASYVEPDVGPDGRLVASRVQLESDIYRFPVDGTPLENTARADRITFQRGQVQTPTVSPDGLRVAYLSDNGGHANVWVTEVGGDRRTRQVTEETLPTVTVGVPRWSPTSDRIVYFRNEGGGADQAEEWLVNSDGTERSVLLEDIIGGAHWSPDGEFVYYTASGALDATEACVWRIHVQTRATEAVRCDASGIVLSPDGATAYFTPSVARQGEILFASPVDTGEPQPFPFNLQSRLPLYPHHYEISPDGQWLASPLKDGDTTNLWKISTQDYSLVPITDFGYRAITIGRQISWSRDGLYIFAAVLETDADIVLFAGPVG